MNGATVHFDYLYCLCGMSLQVQLDSCGDDPADYEVLVDPVTGELCQDEAAGVFVRLADWWAARHQVKPCQPCSAALFASRQDTLEVLDAMWALSAGTACPPG